MLSIASIDVRPSGLALRLLPSAPERRPVDTQDLSGLLEGARAREDALYVLVLDRLERHGVAEAWPARDGAAHGDREEARVHHVAARQDRDALDGVLELADVAGPRVGAK